jgi:hypothetical protein
MASSCPSQLAAFPQDEHANCDGPPIFLRQTISGSLERGSDSDVPCSPRFLKSSPFCCLLPGCLCIEVLPSKPSSSSYKLNPVRSPYIQPLHIYFVDSLGLSFLLLQVRCQTRKRKRLKSRQVVIRSASVQSISNMILCIVSP